MKIRNYLKEVTISGSIGDSYEVPYADGKGKFKTNIPPTKRTLQNIPKDKMGNLKCKEKD
jgi:hypothetical protein